jgi:prophage regulatory protein
MHIEPHANRGDVDFQSAAGPAFFRMPDVIRITALSRTTV